MSKETYLQLKKEFWMRFAFNVGIAGIGLCAIDRYDSQSIALYSLLARGHGDDFLDEPSLGHANQDQERCL